MNLGFDSKYALRLLKKSWGYSLLCASVVALSVGLAIWTYSMAYSQLLKPLGVPNAEHWYSIQFAPAPGAMPRPGSVDAYTYQEILAHNRSAEHLGALMYRTAVLSEGQSSASLRTAAISPRLIAEVVPLKGRTLQIADGQPGATPVAVLSYDTWQNYFAGDPGIIGKTTRVDAAPVQVVGVLPREFYAFQDFELWLPLQLPKLAKPEDSKLMLSPLIRLEENQDLGAIQNEMKAAMDRVNGDHPALFNAKRSVKVIPAHRMYTYASTAMVTMLIFMSAAVLLLGAVNISLVFLARLLERTRELALRTALGSTRSRLLRQSLLETVLIVFVGLVIGWIFAVIGVRWTDAWGAYLNKILAIGRLSATMVLRPTDVFAAIGAATTIWLLSTLVPALRIAKQDAATALAGSGKGSSIRASNRSAGLLVGIQVVISSLVLVICGALVLAVNAEISKPIGVNSTGIVMATSPTVFDERYSEPSKRLRFWEDLTAAVQSKVPGAAVAFSSSPVTRPGSVAATIETREGTAKEGSLMLPLAVVSDNYFEMLGLKLRSGRFFDTTDDAASMNVAIVDEEMASRYWPDQEVVGKRIQLSAKETPAAWVTIVGVVSRVGGSRPYREEDVGAVYRPLRQGIPSQFHLFAKLPNPSNEARVAIRAAAFGVDRDLPLRNLQTLDDYLAAQRFNYESLITIIVVVALITAIVTASGLFGLISRSVAQRTQEVGIRRALGATTWRSTSMFRRQGTLYLIMSMAGVAMGVMVMPLLSREITNILDYAIPVTLGVVFLMIAVIFTASYLPSRRAVALEPGDALRYE